MQWLFSNFIVTYHLSWPGLLCPRPLGCRAGLCTWCIVSSLITARIGCQHVQLILIWMVMFVVSPPHIFVHSLITFLICLFYFSVTISCLCCKCSLPPQLVNFILSSITYTSSILPPPLYFCWHYPGFGYGYLFCLCVIFPFAKSPTCLMFPCISYFMQIITIVFQKVSSFPPFHFLHPWWVIFDADARVEIICHGLDSFAPALWVVGLVCVLDALSRHS